MKRKFRRILTFIFIAIYLCLITSCYEINTFTDVGDETLQNTNYLQSENIVDNGPVNGGTLNLFCTYPDNLDPLLTKNPYLKNYFRFVFDSMVKISKSQIPEGQLCDKWFVSEDGYTWTFHVRENIVWQDGYPLTAEDIKFTIDKLITYKENTIYKANVNNISSVRVIDRYTIEITLKKPNAFTPELMTFPIVSSRFYSNPENVNEAFKSRFPPGTGPFSFKAYEENSHIILTASKSWWRKKLNADGNTLEMPYINDINIKFYKNSREAYSAFQVRNTDVIFASEKDMDLYTGRTAISLKKFINGKWDFISFNLSNPLLSEKTVRQFIYSCIDIGEIIGEVLPGKAIESNIPLIPGTWLHEIQTDNNNKEILEKLYTSTRMKLLENGWEEYNGEFYSKVNGILKPVAFELLVNEENSYRVKVAEKIAENLTNKGIRVTLKTVPWDQMLNLINSKKYDMAILGCTIPDYPDLSFLYSIPYLDNQKPTNSNEYPLATNISGYYNEKVQELIVNIYESRNRDELKKIFTDLINIINEELPYIGLFFYTDAIVYYNNIGGNIDPYLWDGYNNITEWYIIK